MELNQILTVYEVRIDLMLHLSIWVLQAIMFTDTFFFFAFFFLIQFCTHLIVVI